MRGDAVEEQLDHLVGRRGWIVEDRVTEGEHERSELARRGGGRYTNAVGSRRRTGR